MAEDDSIVIGTLLGAFLTLPTNLGLRPGDQIPVIKALHTEDLSCIFREYQVGQAYHHRLTTTLLRNQDNWVPKRIVPSL